jgi:Uma2 family endonuclease
LYITRETNRLAELVDGYLEVLPMPTLAHQLILHFVANLLLEFARPTKLGTVVVAPLRVRLRTGLFREPDVAFMLAANKNRAGNEYWDGADLVMEIVSEDEKSRHRDLVEKRAEYAAAGIAEYWIVDPTLQTVTVLTLPTGASEYAVRGTFKHDEIATSALLPGFGANVSAVFDAANG